MDRTAWINRWGGPLRVALLVAAVVCALVMLTSSLVSISASDGGRWLCEIRGGGGRFRWSSPNTVGWSLGRPDFKGIAAQWAPTSPFAIAWPSIHRGSFGFSPFGSSTNLVRVAVPVWPGLLLAAPAVVRRIRRTPGHCRRCLYDLRGVPGTERCPECGLSQVARRGRLGSG